MNKFVYRPDIDGIRGLSIILVLIFHAFPDILKSGFVGVDIFFVISGFVISKLIIRNFQDDTFSFIDFYSRRIIRIFPALILVLVCTLIFGRLFLFNDEYINLAKHAVSSSIFLSNFTLINESGYFDKSSLEKPLLHLWSLAIEEQFYILWPLILLFFLKKNLKNFIFLLIFLSFLLNIIFASIKPDIGFYLPYCRAWELLSGCLIAFTNIENFKYKNLLSICGLLLLLIAVMFTNKFNFLGFVPIIPVVGTISMILARNSWMNRLFLGNNIIVKIGLISYPLYLWHWPIISFLNIHQINNFYNKFLAIILSFILSIITFLFVEKPIRNSQNYHLKAIILIIIFVSIGLIGISIQKQYILLKQDPKNIYLSYYDPQSVSPNYFSINDLYKKFRTDCDFWDSTNKLTRIPTKKIDKSCYNKNQNFSKTIFLWGDSHAQQFYHALKSNLTSDFQVLIVATSSCSPAIIEIDSSTDYCQKSNYVAIENIKKNIPDIVVISSKNSYEIHDMIKKESYLKKIGVKNVIFVGQNHQYQTAFPKIIARKLWENTPTRTFEGIKKDIIENNLYLVNELKNQKHIMFIDLIGFFCNQDGCLVGLNQEDRKKDLVIYDSDHLSLEASDFVVKNLILDNIF